MPPKKNSFISPSRYACCVFVLRNEERCIPCLFSPPSSSNRIVRDRGDILFWWPVDYVLFPEIMGVYDSRIRNGLLRMHTYAFISLLWNIHQWKNKKKQSCLFRIISLPQPITVMTPGPVVLLGACVRVFLSRSSRWNGSKI